MHYRCGNRTIVLLSLLVFVVSSQILAAEESHQGDSVYAQAIRNVVPIKELQSVCTLGLVKPMQTFVTLGTGFYVLRDAEGELSTWLVTARHVVGSHADLIAKAQASSNEAFLVLPQAKWIYHPGPNPEGLLPIDVAVMRVLVPNDTISFRYCVDKCSIDPKTKQQHMNHLEGLPEPTDHVLFFGYPGGDVNPNEVPPFVRSGIVAYALRNPGFSFNGLQPADEKMFYVDAPSFGGNSGGPVMLEPNPLSAKVRLWGLVTGSSQSRNYTIVTSVTRIKEAINHAVTQSLSPQDSWTRTPPGLEHTCGKNEGKEKAPRE